MKSDIHTLLDQLIYYREHLDSDYDQAVLGIRSIFGGAGSFNDLILQNNGKMLRTENETLSELSDKLYSLIKAEISARKI